MSYMQPPVAFDYVAASSVRCRKDNILIRWLPAPELSKSGLVALPRADFSREIEGKLAEVVSVGPGPAYERKCTTCGHPLNPFELGVKVGDTVIVDSPKCGEIVYVNGIEHRIVREAELLAVLEEDDETHT